jgi:hypothetical protein
MAYDQFPLDVRRKKPLILDDIIQHERVALFSHEPQFTAARLNQETDGQWSVTPLTGL